MSNAYIKPCPLCNGGAKLISGPVQWWHCIQCDTCRILLPDQIVKDDCILLWNQLPRPTVPQPNKVTHITLAAFGVAIYHNDKMIYKGESPYFPHLLRLLGFEVQELPRFHDTREHPEPWPDSLPALQTYLQVLAKKKRQEQIAYHRGELERLETGG